MTTNLLVFKACSIVAFSVALAACGGGSSDTAQGSNAGIGSAPRDSFIAVVLAMVATSPDKAEPQEVDSVTATFPQNAEPDAMGG